MKPSPPPLTNLIPVFHFTWMSTVKMGVSRELRISFMTHCEILSVVILCDLSPYHWVQMMLLWGKVLLLVLNLNSHLGDQCLLFKCHKHCFPSPSVKCVSHSVTQTWLRDERGNRRTHSEEQHVIWIHCERTHCVCAASCSASLCSAQTQLWCGLKQEFHIKCNWAFHMCFTRCCCRQGQKLVCTNTPQITVACSLTFLCPGTDRIWSEAGPRRCVLCASLWRWIQGTHSCTH